MIAPDVSRATVPQSNCGRVLHPERDGRVRRGEQARVVLIQSALRLMAKGDFRPTAQAIALGAGMHPSAVNRLFGSLDLMMKVIARSHWISVERLLPFDTIGIAKLKETVWAVLVGKPRELS